MPTIRVDTKKLELHAYGRDMPCFIGKAGAIVEADKREGDGKTPRGRYALRTLLLRPDRNPAPETALPWRWLRVDDGWSDAAADPAYNRPVTHPHAYSAEHLWRDDGLYDLIIVLGHNDHPPVAGMGSAIFLHCRPELGSATQGCIAIAKSDLWSLIASAQPGDMVTID